MLWRWILRGIALILTTIGGIGTSLLMRFGFDNAEVFGIRIWGGKGDLRIIQPEIEVVNRHRPSSLRRLGSAGVGIICSTRSAVDLRRRRVYVNIEVAGQIAYEIVAVSRAIQLFPVAGENGENLRRIAKMIEEDVMILLSRRLAADAEFARECPKELVEKLRSYLGHHIAEIWNLSVGLPGKPR
jgi:hypothetical protein